MQSVPQIDKPTLSIVVPLFNERQHVPLLLEALSEVISTIELPAELILVDDGSTDGTWESISRQDAQIFSLRAVRLSRNFGKEGAIRVGIESAEGDAVVIMDGDLQHPPQLIVEMIRLWRDEGFEIVDTVKKERGEESLFYKFCAKAFYWLINKFSGVNLKSSSDFKLLDRKAVEALLTMRESTMFFRGMTAWLGFKHTAIPFSVPKRVAGKSSWTFRGLAKLFLDNIVSFSSVPLQIVSAVGALFLLFALGLAVQTLSLYARGEAVTGFTSVILLQLIIGSCVLLGLGVIGMYVATIYEEVKGRPRYIVSEKITRERLFKTKYSDDSLDSQQVGNIG
ncbi:MAG: glycosyltransferase family 2 protein [Bdellovibrionales bacterium]|nr:glycosyltransferase family 2 protein [Bdellovibrionales bacterium]